MTGKTASEYLRSIGGLDCPEEEALQRLIESHTRIRDMLASDMTKFREDQQKYIMAQMKAVDSFINIGSFSKETRDLIIEFPNGVSICTSLDLMADLCVRLRKLDLIKDCGDV